MQQFILISDNRTANNYLNQIDQYCDKYVCHMSVNGFTIEYCE